MNAHDTMRWFHQIDLGGGRFTPGVIPIDVLRAQAEVYFRHGVEGLSVLDVGCWDGFNAFEAERRGASRVLALDHFAWSEKGWGTRKAIDFAQKALRSKIVVNDLDLPNVTPARVGTFDVVLFLGVLYHLRHPFAVLEQIAPIAKHCLIVETQLDALDNPRPAMIFYPGKECGGDPTNWWGPNRLCVEAMLRDLGFVRVEFTLHPTQPDRGIFHAFRE